MLLKLRTSAVDDLQWKAYLFIANYFATQIISGA